MKLADTEPASGLLPNEVSPPLKSGGYSLALSVGFEDVEEPAC
jgi:hypothetical protein